MLSRRHIKQSKRLSKVRSIRDEILFLVPQNENENENEFVQYANNMEKLFRIRGIRHNILVKFIKYGSDISEVQSQLESLSDVSKVRRSVYVFGHGSKRGVIGSDKPDSERIKCHDLLKCLDDHFSSMSKRNLRFRPNVVLTECFGHLHAEGSFRNINIHAVSSVAVPFTLVHQEAKRNLSLMFYYIRSIHSEFFKKS
jgi:hypothetical protein